MPKAKLTQSFIDDLKPSNRTTTHWDESLSGFGVKITEQGTKTFVLQRRFQKHEYKATIGRTNIFKLQAARDQARAMIGQIAKGENPFVEQRYSVKDFQDFFDLYMTKHAQKEKKPRSIAEDKRLIDNHLIPRLKRINPETMTRDDVVHLKKTIAGEVGRSSSVPASKARSHLKGGKPTANRCLALLSKSFNFALDEKFLTRLDNPVVRITRYKEHRKEEFLSGEELKALRISLNKARQLSLEEPAALDAIKILMLTGARLSEIREMRWDEVDLGNQIIAKPDTKTGPRKIFFCPLVGKIIRRRMKNRRASNGYVFPGVRGDKAISLRKPWERIRSAAGLSQKYTIHTLRHTFASHAIVNGVSAHQLQVLLGHSSVETTSIYVTIAESTSSNDVNSISNILTRSTGKM